jgi:hypothetical protein
MSRKQYQAQVLARGGSFHKDQKRDRVMRVRNWTFERLGELGSAKNDHDDVIFMLLQEHEELQRIKEYLHRKGIKVPVSSSDRGYG